MIRYIAVVLAALLTPSFLFSIADNNIPERAVALAKSIVERDAHLVGLQEMFRFECLESDTIPGACLLFSAAMSDHLELTSFSR